MENIKRLFLEHYAVSIVLLTPLFIAGCAASDGTAEDRSVTDTGRDDATAEGSTPRGKRPSPGFNVQADTLTAHSRRKGVKGNSSVSVRSTASKKYYSVQIGAYKLKGNADRNFALCLQRFKQPVIKFYAPGIKMERLCVGRFSTAKAAKVFAAAIQEQYPKDYHNVWVTVLQYE